MKHFKIEYSRNLKEVSEHGMWFFLLLKLKIKNRTLSNIGEVIPMPITTVLLSLVSYLHQKQPKQNLYTNSTLHHITIVMNLQFITFFITYASIVFKWLLTYHLIFIIANLRLSSFLHHSWILHLYQSNQRDLLFHSVVYFVCWQNKFLLE